MVGVELVPMMWKRRARQNDNDIWTKIRIRSGVDSQSHHDLELGQRDVSSRCVSNGNKLRRTLRIPQGQSLSSYRTICRQRDRSVDYGSGEV